MSRPLFEVAGVIATTADRIAPYLPEPVQGGWWYRGEFVTEPHPRGTRVVHRVHNVATRGRWAVPLANRLFIGYRANLARGLTARLAEIAAELGVTSHPDS
ncbi:hypothetical protein ABZ816_04690 [Actinosynnema sp. NPDC047251]|uniref:Polyketide cyclase/dehydrase n=1 Tax=Saccharothrix espanaensis (strain ATCC 51144 / DSM 44229 / JCM 9112 / NBRC 15066 / NRRL 15764) TaxID=1179773 RepID=K0JUN8_SACES|nr:hypothetical protein [Saccharothrix espanaensis]CCH31560.1 hypothetical protein BN6_42770 [Saccharothrix espanaensis DSM 44229]